MAKLLSLSLSLCFLLFSGCFAFRQQPQQNECQFQNLNALEPDNQIQSEAGLIETWNPNNPQFRCAGVAFSRCTLQRNGLRRPFYTNAPQEIFIQQGSGMFGMIFPGCAETFEEPQESERGQGRRPQDRHQKVHRFREGDVIAVPTGVAFWMYNPEDTPVIAVSLIDTSSLENQLDQMPRRFYLAGNQEQEFLQYQQQQGRRGQQGGRQSQPSRREGQQGRRGQKEEGEENQAGSVFKGFADEFLEAAFQVNNEIVRKLKGQNEDEERGAIIRAEHLSIISPPVRQQHQGHKGEEEEEEEDEKFRPRPRPQTRQEEEEGEEFFPRGRGNGRRPERNGLEETVCTMRLHQNIGKSTSPDIYNPQAGSLRTLNSLDLPVLRWLKLSAEYGSLHRGAMFVPHFNMNANSVIYALRGRAWLQVVDCSGNAVFDGELEAGQVLTVPQNFAVAAKALTDKFLYVAFKTNDRAMIATLAGGTSLINGMPEEVVAHSFNLQREQARQLKNNNPFSFLVPPRESEMRAVA